MNLKVKLIIMNFLEFAVWGSYLTCMGGYLATHGLAGDIGWFYAVQGIVSLFMPALLGIVADRWIQAQKVLSLAHVIAGVFMLIAGAYAMSAGDTPSFWPLFLPYTISVAFFMPTIGLANSVAFNALTKAGMDTVKAFPPIRVFGTIGFICAMLTVDFTGLQHNYGQFFMSGGFSILLAIYALFMPKCPVNKNAESSSLVDVFGLRAFTLFKQKKMAIFFIFSMLLGVSLQITNGFANPFLTAFEGIKEYADTFAAQHANALISLSQISETLCILLIPFCMKRFGIKNVMLIAMFAWVFRFGFFGMGNPGMPGVILFVLSCVVYGVAFDFFNISGALYVDQQTDESIRSSAQGLFMVMTNGIGATIGTLSAQAIVDHFVNAESVVAAGPSAVMNGWATSWYIFAAYALVVAVSFFFIFKDPRKEEAAKLKTA
ncbi:MAG: MFS transporter [Muribaculaceae bacterium]|nr:MFS transporter [Muribaculaceae bacterium]